MPDSIISIAEGTLKVKYNKEFIVCYPKTKHSQVVDFREGVEDLTQPISVLPANDNNKVFDKGRILIEYDNKNRIRGMKIGDGKVNYLSLPYVQSRATQFDIERKNPDNTYTKIEQE